MPILCDPDASGDYSKKDPCYRSPAPADYPNKDLSIGAWWNSEGAAQGRNTRYRRFREPSFSCGASKDVDYIRLWKTHTWGARPEVVRIECSPAGGVLLLKRLHSLDRAAIPRPPRFSDWEWNSAIAESEMGAMELSIDQCQAFLDPMVEGGFWELWDEEAMESALVGLGETHYALEGIHGGVYNNQRGRSLSPASVPVQGVVVQLRGLRR